MSVLYTAFETLQEFFNSGGPVLKILFVAIALLWILIAERFTYIYWQAKKGSILEIEKWSSREDRHSWFAMRVRDRIISQIRHSLSSSIPVIKTIVVLCPLLGLLGTVTGMIHVFDVMSFSGTGDARSMASGISQATIPTMAGMVGALTGIYFSAKLESKIATHIDAFASELN